MKKVLYKHKKKYIFFLNRLLSIIKIRKTAVELTRLIVSSLFYHDILLSLIKHPAIIITTCIPCIKQRRTLIDVGLDMVFFLKFDY